MNNLPQIIDSPLACSSADLLHGTTGARSGDADQDEQVLDSQVLIVSRGKYVLPDSDAD